MNVVLDKFSGSCAAFTKSAIQRLGVLYWIVDSLKEETNTGGATFGFPQTSLLLPTL